MLTVFVPSNKHNVFEKIKKKIVLCVCYIGRRMFRFSIPNAINAIRPSVKNEKRM